MKDKNKHLEAQQSTIKICSILFLMLFLTSFISALELNPFATIKTAEKTITAETGDYLKTDFNSQYGTIKLSKTFFWFETDRIAEYSLTKNTESCLMNCEAEGKVTLYQDGVLFDDVKFKTLKGKDTSIKSSEYLVFDSYKDNFVKVPIYKEVCVDNLKNKSKSCSQVITGYLEENKPIEIWNKYNSEVLKAGNYRWKIKGVKDSSQSVDFIPIINKKEFSEWAVWSPNIYESFTFRDNSDNVLNTEATAQSIYIRNDSFNLVNVSIYLANTFGCGTTNFTVVLKSVNNATGVPIGNNLSSGSIYALVGSDYTWYNATMSDYYLANNTNYSLVVTHNCVSEVRIGIDYGDGSAYPYGCASSSADRGTTWTSKCAEWDMDFILYGNSFPIDTSPTVTLNSPINYYNSTLNLVALNCSAGDDRMINNISLWINGIRNYTITNGVTNFSEIYFNRNLGDGVYNWTCSADDNSTTTKTGWATNRTLTIDTLSPIINILAPLTNSEVLTSINPTNVSFNISVTDSNIGSCWYFNGTANVTATCNKNLSIYLSEGYNTLIYYANDTFGNAEASNSTTFFINYYNSTGASYSSSVLEQENTTIRFNISATNLSSASANITYNGTTYVMSGLTNGTFAQFSINLVSPSVIATQPINFSIKVLINSAVSLIFGNYTQLVYNAEGVSFSASCADSNRAYNYTLKDEENFTILSGNLDYNLKWGTSKNNTKYSSFGKLSTLNSFYLCINSSIPINWSIGEGELAYSSVGYVDRRYYIFSGTSLTNITQNVTLYSLASSIQTSFKLDVESTSLSPYSNKYVSLIRWYPDLNEYNFVDMGKTDEKGASVIHVRTEDVDYRIGVYELNGTLIKLANPIRMVCLVSPCTYTLQISPTEKDYTSFLNIESSLDYNKTSGIWTFIWSDKSAKTQSMNLTIWKMGGSEVFPVCSNTISGASGAITCNTSIYLASETNLEGIVVRTASPPVVIASKSVLTKTNAFASPYGLFLSFLIGIPIIFIFALMSPIGAIIGGVIALIPALYFGAINWAILGGIAVLAGIVIHFLKRI